MVKSTLSNGVVSVAPSTEDTRHMFQHQMSQTDRVRREPMHAIRFLLTVWMLACASMTQADTRPIFTLKAVADYATWIATGRISPSVKQAVRRRVLALQ
jgi:hypothetical protein